MFCVERSKRVRACTGAHTSRVAREQNEPRACLQCASDAIRIGARIVRIGSRGGPMARMQLMAARPACLGHVPRTDRLHCPFARPPARRLPSVTPPTEAAALRDPQPNRPVGDWPAARRRSRRGPARYFSLTRLIHVRDFHVHLPRMAAPALEPPSLPLAIVGHA